MVIIISKHVNTGRLDQKVLLVLASTACRQLLQKWWKVIVFFLITFIFLCLFNLPLSRHNLHHFHHQHQDPAYKVALVKSSIKSVLSTDRQLRLLASQAKNDLTPEDFIHPNANRNDLLNGYPRARAVGPRMNTVQEMIKVTEVSIDINRPCRRANENGDDLLVIVFLFCLVRDFSRRQTIRETYGSALKNIPQTEIYFVVGRIENETLETKLQNESLVYNDILQFNFHDDYHNLTLKSVATVRWTALHCSHTTFALKMDSDGFIRVNPFLDEVSTFSADTLYGAYRTAEAVLRDPQFKWYIDPLYWPYSTYPPYHAGPYLFPGSGAARLYAAVVSSPTTDTLPALPFDDCYTTGVLAQKANLSRASFPGLRLLQGQDKMMEDDILGRYSVFFETLNNDDLRRIWALFGDS